VLPADDFNHAEQNGDGKRLRRFADVAVLALGGEELGPRINLGMLLEERPPLAFSHAPPDTELHLVVKRVGEALGDDGTVPADDSRLPLRRSANEQFVGIGGATPRPRHPRDAGFSRRTDEQCHLNNAHSAGGRRLAYSPTRNCRKAHTARWLGDVAVGCLMTRIALDAVARRAARIAILPSAPGFGGALARYMPRSSSAALRMH
jgi:hypothetical protein